MQKFLCRFIDTYTHTENPICILSVICYVRNFLSELLLDFMLDLYHKLSA